MSASAPDARGVALEALVRIDRDGAYANLVLPGLLDASGLARRDRSLATELVYGTTRMRRACDWLVGRHLRRRPAVEARNALRLGAYQLQYLRVPSHAAVATTVSLVAPRSRPLVNAVLRRVAGRPPEWPDDATRLSYPDWILDRLLADLGRPDTLAALEHMNLAAAVTVRADGYTQDRASQWVAVEVDARAGERVLDMCAAPGGKATAMAAAGAHVVAADLLGSRARLLAGNVRRLAPDSVSVIVADGRRLPHRAGSFDRVLADAPCSGLGVLHRRPDARWRVAPTDVDDLAALQHQLLEGAAAVVRAGGTLVYSVCTFTSAETLDLDRRLAATHPELEALPAPQAPWRPHGRGAMLLPQAAGTDGMYLLRLRRRPAADTVPVG